MFLSPISFTLLLLAGVASGLLGYLTGLASLISYPVMLAMGLPPILANTSNTVGVVTTGLGSGVGTIRELRETDTGLRASLATAFFGGLVGSILLLVGGNDLFGAIAPWLIGIAALVMAFSPRLRLLHGDRDSPKAAAVALALLCVYGGYFGAGSGVMYIATMSILSSSSMALVLMRKSVIFSVANLTATVIFVVTGNVHWGAAIAMGLGSLVGGYLGPRAQKHVPDRVLRPTVAVCGLVLAAWLAVR